MHAPLDTLCWHLLLLAGSAPCLTCTQGSPQSGPCTWTWSWTPSLFWGAVWCVTPPLSNSHLLEAPWTLWWCTTKNSPCPVSPSVEPWTLPWWKWPTTSCYPYPGHRSALISCSATSLTSGNLMSTRANSGPMRANLARLFSWLYN